MGNTYLLTMILESLTLINFKNYHEASLRFSPKINCFTGPNGSGKTNLLDAIHYLSLCKSFFGSMDSQHVRFGEEFFMIQGLFEKEGRKEEVTISVKRGQKKLVKRNKNDYEKLSDHIGVFPVVMISPLDGVLITGGSDQRRRFVDGIISQFDKQYLERLIKYNELLQQRNALLKQFSLSRSFDSALMEVMDEQLIGPGQYILEARLAFLTDFAMVFGKIYRDISGGAEEVALNYVSTLGERTYALALKEAIRKDCALEHTSVGIHRDDLQFLLAGHEVKKYASQGQQKTYLLALKLAQYEYMKKKTGTKPLLLLDDVYDKLDNERFTQLISLVSSDAFGQVFITDTSYERMKKLFNANKECRIFSVNNSLAEII